MHTSWVKKDIAFLITDAANKMIGKTEISSS